MLKTPKEQGAERTLKRAKPIAGQWRKARARDSDGMPDLRTLSTTNQSFTLVQLIARLGLVHTFDRRTQHFSISHESIPA